LAKGLCSTHYKHAKNGEKLKPIRNNTTLMDRLWFRVDKSSDCWLWTGATNNNGYGVIWNKNKLAYVHRVVWEDLYGPIPIGKEVCHKCDNPACVQPNHLFCGAHEENMIDMAKKLRCGSSKIDTETIKQIAEMYRDGIGRKKIADTTGVNINTLKCILNGRNWSHITGFGTAKK